MNRLFLTSISALLSGLVLVSSSAIAQSAASEEIDECLSCHGQEDLSMTLENGEEAPLFMKRELLAESVHKGLRCTDCHAGLDQVPHPGRHYKNLAQFRASFGEACKTCHFENYTKTLDSVHYVLQARGDVFAPTCVKCHGSHDIAPPAQPRSRISKTCATCHLPISQAYAKSVHGKALIEQDNRDVPVCTDCHRSHDIADPRNRAWLMNTPALCGKCHADEQRMKKYGLSTAVLSTYLSDFHGATASFGAQGSQASTAPVVALCVDCHGIHDIGKVTGKSAAAFRSNLVKTCRKCHPGASANFPAAWLSHYEPSLSRAPLVYLVKLFYRIIIPFIVGGLILQILLHLWRTVVNR
jgi:predicted CXXCH cytochrome family protein